MKNKGFTLIELIVVITILAILGTIAFIGFKGYTSDARDSKITTDIANLHNILAILKASEGSVPMPDSAAVVKSGTLDITYEGEVGDNVRNTLKASSDAKTPVGENYKYAVNGTQKDFTLVGELENDTAGITTNAFAEGEANTKYFKGDEVLTLFDANNNFIGGNVDVAVSGISKAYIGDTEMTISAEVVQKLPQSIKENKGVMYDSCKSTLDAGFSKGNGIYSILLNGKTQKVYCDMTTDGGGWTLAINLVTDTSLPDLYNTILGTTPTFSSNYLIGINKFNLTSSNTIKFSCDLSTGLESKFFQRNIDNFENYFNMNSGPYTGGIECSLNSDFSSSSTINGECFRGDLSSSIHRYYKGPGIVYGWANYNGGNSPRLLRHCGNEWLGDGTPGHDGRIWFR